ncbi:MAG: aminomethyl-transferring glycine dehydrogenase [Vulcanimicrobiota bacterium]
MKTEQKPLLRHPDQFESRHLGPRPAATREMLESLGLSSLEEMIEEIIPEAIRSQAMDLPEAIDEQAALARMGQLAESNQVFRSYIGCGYIPSRTPPVIQRNILENPGWYTQYTPYQSEISQGRLEALLNYQTMICDLTGLEVANSSLLDEATAAAEAMTMALRTLRKAPQNPTFLVDADCHPQVIAVVESRALPLEITVKVAKPNNFEYGPEVFGCLLAYPTTDGAIPELASLIAQAKEHQAVVAVATDLLALTRLRAPGELGADICVGSSQRLGMPLGYGGPHAAFMSSTGIYKRQIPGRIVGLSTDRRGNPALRLALQTREQHIRRDKATSNICTAQVLPAVVASFYGVYHGPEGMRAIADYIHQAAATLAAGLEKAGHKIVHDRFFDTVRVALKGLSTDQLRSRAEEARLNLRYFDNGEVGITLDERVTEAELSTLLGLFGYQGELPAPREVKLPEALTRQSDYMTHPNFARYRSETELLRYMRRLESRDLSLTTSMIALGSCTMKLNGTAEMMPITWPALADIHPFAPVSQAQGYQTMITELEGWLAQITGFAGVSLQPNAGSQGEYAGLLLIRAYHHSRGDDDRKVVLIPVSAHGTNPASAALAGLETVAVACDHQGNIDLDDLRAKATQHEARLAALMVTYPSTHGVFEETLPEVCKIVHQHGGQVYLDGANMNALVGWCRPGQFGADVCHLNLHKTFCIPHGGGGPGMGPVCVAPHLVDFLPGHPCVKTGGKKAIGPVSAAPWGSPLVLPITYTYIALMGKTGLRRATEVAILNANYIANRLKEHYSILYTGRNDRVAHECIVDVRPFKHEAGIEVEDIAKRLMDFGFHAPTMSWPVPGTLMIEPTESESRDELDRFCEAMIVIRQEIRDIAEGRADRLDNPLKSAPHTALEIASDQWDHGYSREQAAYPAPWTREHKFWPPVGRVDNVKGDRNLICSCQDWFHGD